MERAKPMSGLLLLWCLLQDPAPVEKPKPAPTTSSSDPAQDAKGAQPEKEIVIIGDRHPSDVLDVPTGVTVVTGANIKDSGATNIVEVVQKQPGFFASGGNKGAYDQIVDIRGYNNGGGNGQRVLVLVDGRRTNTVTGNVTDWSSIPIENIERIEIVRGPAGALYGDGALAGVVNIITKKGGEGNVGSASGGNWGTYQAAVNVGGDVRDALWDLYANTEGTEGWRHHSKYAGDNVTARIDLPVTDTLQGFLKVGHHNDRRQEPGSLSEGQIDLFGRRYADPTRVGDTTLEENYADLGLTQSLGALGEASVFLDHTQRDENTFSEQFGTFETSDQSQITMLQFKHVIRPDVPSLHPVFTTGIDLSYETANADSGQPGTALDTSTYQRRLVGAFEHVEARPLPVLLLSGGVRFDRALLLLDRHVAPGGFGDSIDRLRAFDEPSPMAGVTWKVTNELSAYASWGKTFKLPTRDELVGFLTTDPGLEAEKAQTYEAGARFWTKPWGWAGVTFYQMKVRNELFFDDASFSEVNLPKVTHQGVEADFRVSPWPWLEVFGMYAFTKVTIDQAVSPSQDGNTYPVTPRHAANGGVTVKEYGASLTVSGRYAGARYLTNDLDNVQPQLPPYWVYDLKISYTWKSLTVFGSIYNFTDRKYDDNGGASLFGAPARFNPGPERSWLLGGEVTF
jgi:iron complex outermembrane receptor protein